jgi:hypothetical protein
MAENIFDLIYHNRNYYADKSELSGETAELWIKVFRFERRIVRKLEGILFS